MTGKQSMFLFYFSITLAICSSALYHFVAKSTPSNVNFTVSLLVTYAVAFVGIEYGFLLTYRAGWNLGIAAVLVNVVASLILLPVAIFLFKDKISWINILGIVVCFAGLVMLNWKR